MCNKILLICVAFILLCIVPIDGACSIDVEYIMTNTTIIAACLFPNARDKDEQVQAIIEQHGVIFYQTDFVLELYGPRNFLALIYDGEEWIDTNAYLSSKVNNCFNVLFGYWPMRVYFIAMQDHTKILSCKYAIRALFNLETHSIHMTDTHEEAVRLAQKISTADGISCLNNSIPCKLHASRYLC